MGEIVNDCIEWAQSKNSHGYGQLNRRINGKRRLLTVHRIAWQVYNHRPIPPGMFVMHTCDNPACVSPAHLTIGTPSDNSRDMVRKGRRANSAALSFGRRTHCPHGHPYDEVNTYVGPRGWRTCRACRAAGMRKKALYRIGV